MSIRQKSRRFEVGGRGRRIYVVALAAAALLGLTQVDLGAVSTTMRQPDGLKSEPIAISTASAGPDQAVAEPLSLAAGAPVVLASLTTVGVVRTLPHAMADMARLPAAPGPEVGQLAALTRPAAVVEPGATASSDSGATTPGGIASAPVSSGIAGQEALSDASALDASAQESYVVIGSYSRLEVAARHVSRNRHWKPVLLPVLVDGRRRNLVAIGPFLREQLAETLQLVIWDGFGDAWTFSPGQDSRIRTALTDGQVGGDRRR